MKSSRERMVESALQLLATRGLQATSFSEVIALSGAPRGSIYHHFPGGKDQLVAEALGLADERARATLGAAGAATAPEVVDAFLGLWRELLTATKFRAGCSVTAVTIAADSRELLDRAAEIFRSWTELLVRDFEAAGLPPDSARQLAATLIAACEGAVVLSRAERSIEPFEDVAGAMVALTSALVAGSA